MTTTTTTKGKQPAKAAVTPTTEQVDSASAADGKAAAPAPAPTPPDAGVSAADGASNSTNDAAAGANGALIAAGNTDADAGAGSFPSGDAEGDEPTAEIVIGNDALANGDVLQELLQYVNFPIKVRIINAMPRPVSFPELQGLFLGHMAGKPETTQGDAVFRDADQLHRFVTDVHALCQLNGFKDGVRIQPA